MRKMHGLCGLLANRAPDVFPNAENVVNQDALRTMTSLRKKKIGRAENRTCPPDFLVYAGISWGVCGHSEVLVQMRVKLPKTSRLLLRFSVELNDVETSIKKPASLILYMVTLENDVQYWGL